MRVEFLVPPLSDKPNNASTKPQQCVAPLVRPLWDKYHPASPPPRAGGGIAGERVLLFLVVDALQFEVAGREPLAEPRVAREGRDGGDAVVD